MTAAPGLSLRDTLAQILWDDREKSYPRNMSAPPRPWSREIVENATWNGADSVLRLADAILADERLVVALTHLERVLREDPPRGIKQEKVS